MSLDCLNNENAPHATGYLLLFRNTGWDGQVPADQIQQAIAKVNAWFEGLSASGKLVAAQPLLDETVVISGKGGGAVTDGPFSEAKEVIGGYVLLSTTSLEEAIEIAKGNPMHEYGLTTEVRATASGCPHIYRALNQLAEAAV